LYVNAANLKSLTWQSSAIIRAMAVNPEQSSPLGSHQFIDQLALAYHREIAARLLASPDEVLDRARSNLKRWMKVHAGTGTVHALEEWQTLINTLLISELVAKMTEDSDEGQRLRQSTPFGGVLSEQERKEIFARCEKGIFA